MNPLAQWRGKFGDDYTERNRTRDDHTALDDLWAQICVNLDPMPHGIIEVGAGSGHNLTALWKISPGSEFLGIDPNQSARDRLIERSIIHVRNGTAQQMDLDDEAADMVFTSGVLIHIPPDQLGAACDEIYRVTKRYIVCIEYFSPEPEEVEYRGRRGMMWRRDFGSFWMKQHRDLRHVGHGFAWKGATGLDNLTWWAFSK
jgi:pseudaminic acid biosynthesis-associated methylase